MIAKAISMSEEIRNMNCLFSTTTNYNFDEYKRYSLSLLLKRSRIIWFVILEAWIFLLGCLMTNYLLILFAIIYPIVIALLQKRQIKKVWNSNKVAQNMNVRFDFYDTYFTEINDNGETRLEYDKLHKVIETKTNFYLMIAKNQGFILKKSNFPEGLEDFLRNIKIS